MANFADDVEKATPRDDSQDFVEVSGRKIYRGKGRDRVSDAKWAEFQKAEEAQKPLRDDGFTWTKPDGKREEEKGQFILGPGAKKTIDRVYPPGSEERKSFDAWDSKTQAQAWVDAENKLTAEEQKAAETEKARIAKMPLAKEIPAEAPASEVRKRGIDPQEDAEEADSEVRGGATFKGLPVGEMVGKMTAGALPDGTDMPSGGVGGGPATPMTSGAGGGGGSEALISNGSGGGPGGSESGATGGPGGAESVPMMGRTTSNPELGLGDAIISGVAPQVAAVEAAWPKKQPPAADGTDTAAEEADVAREAAVMAARTAAPVAAMPEMETVRAPAASVPQFSAPDTSALQRAKASAEEIAALKKDTLDALTTANEENIKANNDLIAYQNSALAEQQEGQQRRMQAAERAMNDSMAVREEAVRRAAVATDPDRFWNSRSNGQKAAGVIAGALFGFGGQGMQWLQHLDSLIDRDVRMQQADRTSVVNALEAQAAGLKGMAAFQMDAGARDNHNFELERQSRLAMMKAQIDNIALKASLPEQKAKAIQMGMDIDMKLQESLARDRSSLDAREVHKNNARQKGIDMQYEASKLNAQMRNQRAVAQYQVAAKGQGAATRGQAAMDRIFGKFQSGLVNAKRVMGDIEKRTDIWSRAKDTFRDTGPGKAAAVVGIMGPSESDIIRTEITKAFQGSDWYAPVAQMLKNIENKTGLGLYDTLQSELYMKNLVKDLEANAAVINSLRARGVPITPSTVPPEIAGNINWKRLNEETGPESE